MMMSSFYREVLKSSSKNIENIYQEIKKYLKTNNTLRKNTTNLNYKYNRLKSSYIKNEKK